MNGVRMNKFFQIAFFLLLTFALGVFGTLLIKGILNLIDFASTGVIGACMFKPSLTVEKLITPSRKYGETSPIRYFGGLHTPAYRVLNALENAVLNDGFGSVFLMNTSRGQHKFVGVVGVVEVLISYGYSSVRIGARQIFAIDEWTREIYHIDASGRLHVSPYNQEYNMTDVIAQVLEAFEVVKEHLKPVPVEAYYPKETWNVVKSDRPTLKSHADTVSVRATYISRSKELVTWSTLEVLDGTNIKRRTHGSWYKSYKVEIDGVVAWLPHSLIGEVYNTPFTARESTVTLQVPRWWFNKQILSKVEVPF